MSGKRSRYYLKKFVAEMTDKRLGSQAANAIHFLLSLYIKEAIKKALMSASSDGQEGCIDPKDFVIIEEELMREFG